MNADSMDERLPCDRLVQDVLAQVAAGRAADLDAHQQQCLHCRAALAEYDRLWAPVRELAAEEVAAPESVVDRALRRIRGAVEHIDYGVLTSPQGSTWIAARVVMVTARETANSVPGVRVALSRHLVGRSPDAARAETGPGSAGGSDVAAGVAGRSTAIEITLVADYGVDLQSLGERVRAAVTARVRDLTDLEPIYVTVIIDDVFE
jgi:uncharacterized alkaline shock family protein YloU